MRYFQAVASLESINLASQKLFVSTSALSKAIKRLEEELQVDLFVKDGRNIRLTEKGKLFHKKAQQLIDLEKGIKVSLSEEKSKPEITIAGPEVFLANYGVSLIRDWQKKFPEATFTFMNIDQSAVNDVLASKKADICITTNLTQKNAHLDYKQIDKTNSATYIGPKHPLYNKKGSIPVSELLKYDFLSPSEETGQISDGWRDDKFPRNLRYKDVGLKTLESLIESGMAVGYLPTSLGDTLKAKKIEITGCPYKCEQKVFLVFNKDDLDWLL